MSIYLTIDYTKYLVHKLNANLEIFITQNSMNQQSGRMTVWDALLGY